MKKEFELYEEFMKSYTNCDDVQVKNIKTEKNNIKIVYIQNLVDFENLNKFVVEPIISCKTKLTSKNIINNFLYVTNVEVANKLDEISQKMLSGFAIIFFLNENDAVCVSAIGYQKRAITEPPTSAVLKGPREGFIEDFDINLSLIRRRIKSEHLAVKNFTVGKLTKTQVGIVYLDNVADIDVIKEITKKIENINIDGIIDSNYIQSFLENPRNKFFKQVGNSEKPDVIVSKILEGRVAIIVDGSPMVLTVPFILLEDFQSADDYYSHPYRATFIRSLRFFGVFLAIMLPGLYVAMQSYHYSIFPNNFLISLLNSIESLSFPPLVEIMIVLFLFEILNEASVRMPKYLGMALSIVGALILGDTAVKAGLISSPSVMMVAISGICMYTVPDQVPETSILRVIFTVLGGVAGFYGMLLGTLFIFAYMADMNNFGAPYLAPLAPHIKSDLKDGIFKKDLKEMKARPKSIPNENKERLVYDNSTEQ